MNAHKLALLRAYDGQPAVSDYDPDQPSAMTRKERVWLKAFLAHELQLAKEELSLAIERERGQAWWLEYIEGPADKELYTTLRLSVPPRKGESVADYKVRLWRVEMAFRARLPPHVRDRGGGEPEDEL